MSDAQYAPMYEEMMPVRRVDVFNTLMNETIGDDLKSVLWLRSKSSEKWLLRRTNYTRSLAVMSMGVAVQKKREPAAVRLSVKYSKLWAAAEVLLFVLVGATVDLQYVASAGLAAIALIFGALLFRMAGVLCCLLRTPLQKRERLFCTVAYMPKATVQAAIGGLPLAAGLSCGHLVLTVAVLAILITAPLGAFGIDLLYRRCLRDDSEAAPHTS